MGTNPTEPRKASLWSRFRLVVLVPLARLRFLVILGAIGLVIVKWDWLVAQYAMRPGPPAATDAADNVEYFCPMHPTVVRDNNKEKCPICFMPLSKRKKGEATDEAAAGGHRRRVQLSPYRVVLAGVQTAPVGYVPLAKEIDHRRHRRVRRAGPEERRRRGSRGGSTSCSSTRPGSGSRRPTIRWRRSTARTSWSPCRTCSTPGRPATRTWKQPPATAWSCGASTTIRSTRSSRRASRSRS